MICRRWLLVPFCAVFLGGVSCRMAGPLKTPVPVVKAPVAEPRSLSEQFVVQTVNRLRDAFTAEDAGTFLSSVSSGFYKGRSRMADSLKTVFGTTRTLALDVTVREITEDTDRATARIRWSRTFVREESGREDTVEGESTLVFFRTDTLRLLDFSGAPPFGIPGF